MPALLATLDGTILVAFVGKALLFILVILILAIIGAVAQVKKIL
jgi:hypothetical protein